VGQSLDEIELAQLEAEDVTARGIRWAYGQIARRPRSESEIRQGLRQRNLTPAQQDQVLERLRTRGWLDDQAFADAWVENRRAFRPRSALALRAELRQKGVPAAQIAAALAAQDDEASALEAGRKAARRWASAGTAEFQSRLTAYLMRRGFDYSISARTARRLWEEMGAVGEETDPVC
jgi:regulatory protein